MQLGLNLKTANLAAAAGVDNWNDLTTQQQQAIIVQEILNQTAAKYGGIVDSAASRQAAFTAQLANTKLALGQFASTIWGLLAPVLTKILVYLEAVFTYATKVVTALLKVFGISAGASAAATPSTQLSTNNNTSSVSSGIPATKASADSSDKATSSNDKLAKSYDNVGDSAKKSAGKVKESSEEMSGALAGFDEINTLSFDKGGSDASDAIDDAYSSLGDYGDLGGDLSNALLDGLSAGLGGLGALLTDPVDETADKIAAILKDMLEPFKDAWDVLGDRWIAAWNKLKDQCKNTFKAIGSYVESLWSNGLKTFVQHLAEIGLAAGIVSMEIGTRLLKAFEKLCQYLDPTVNKVTKGMLDSLNKAAEATRDFILGITEHFNSLMDNGLEQFFMNFADTFHKAITACADIWTVFIDSMDKLLDHLDPIVNKFTQALLDDMNKAIISVGDTFSGFADLVENFANNGGQELINAIGDLIVVIMDFGARVVELGSGALTDLFNHLNPETNPVAKNCIDSFTQFVNHIRDAIKTFGDIMQTALDNGLQDFINNIADCILLIGDFAVTLGGDLISSITNFFNSWAGQTVIAIASQALAVLSDVLKGLLEILNGPLGPLVETLVAGFLAFQGVSKVVAWLQPLINIISMLGSSGGIVSLATSAMSSLWAVIAANPITATIAAVVALGVGLVALYNNCEGFREVIDNIIAAFSGFAEAIKKNIMPIIDTVKNIFGDLIDIIVGIFTGDGQKVGEAVASLVENILTLLGQFTKAFVEIGWELIKGLVKGIWECIKAIPKLLAGIGEFVIDFFKGLFGIHSPSKVFAELGGFLIDGLVEGISDFSSVTNTLSNLGTTCQEYMTGVVEKIVGVFSDIGTRISEKFGSVKTTISEMATNLKEAFNFKWKLPDIKTPKISWEVSESSLGFKYPKFNITWNRNGGLINSPGVIGTQLAGGGEAGKEVVVPSILAA